MSSDDPRQKLSDGITQQLLIAMTEGVPITDSDGNAILDDEGNPRMMPPSAAMIGQAIKWMDRLKTGGGKDSDQPKDPLEAAIAHLRASQKEGGRMPPLDDEGEDDATS